MTGKTRFLAAIPIALGISLVLWYRHDKPSTTSSTTESLTPLSVTQDKHSQDKHSPDKPTPIASQIGTNGAVDPKEWLEKGPKDALAPREIHVDAELAPGSVLTAEPLVPREIHVNAELAPGSSATLTPLTPREIKTDAPTP
jgi:hypothetical protein